MSSFTNAIKGTHPFGNSEQVAAAQVHASTTRLFPQNDALRPSQSSIQRSLNFAASNPLNLLRLGEQKNAVVDAPVLSARLKPNEGQQKAREFKQFARNEIATWLAKDYREDPDDTLGAVAGALPLPPLLKVPFIAALGMTKRAKDVPSFVKNANATAASALTDLAHFPDLADKLVRAKSLMTGVTERNVEKRYQIVEEMIEQLQAQKIFEATKWETVIQRTDARAFREDPLRAMREINAALREVRKNQGAISTTEAALDEIGSVLYRMRRDLLE